MKLIGALGFENLLIFFGIPHNFPAEDIAPTVLVGIAVPEYFAASHSPSFYKTLYCKLI